MATSRVSRRPARALVVAAVAAVSLTLAPTSGYAEPDADDSASPQPAATEPTTVADAQGQVVELNHQLEIVTEQYNDARILLDQREAEAAVATAQLGQVQRDIGELDGQVRQVARSAYTGDQLAGFTVLMTSGSPQEFLDKLNTLDAISGHSNDLVAEFARAQQQARDLAAQADQALTKAEAAANDVESKKARIETDLPVVEALLASLTEQERQAAFARAEAEAVTQAASEAASEADSEAPSQAGDERVDEPDRADRSERGAPSSPIAAPTQAAQIAVDTAYAQLGDPYEWAADGPDSFDCSGLTMYSYAAAGISLPHSSRMQYEMGVAVPRDQLLPGDLVFFYNPISHVAIYIGNGNMITAPQTGDVVKIQSINAMTYTGARRVATGG